MLRGGGDQIQEQGWRWGVATVALEKERPRGGRTLLGNGDLTRNVCHWRGVRASCQRVRRQSSIEESYRRTEYHRNALMKAR